MALSKLQRSRSRHISRACFETLEGRRLMSFSPAVSYPAGTNPQDVVTADLNGDGMLDLATANSGTNNVSVRLGNALGGFDTAQHFAAGSNPRSIVVGDFNQDGKLDLATVNTGSRDVTALLGNGDGIFQAPVSTGIGNADPMSLAVIDFDGGGPMDLAVGSIYHDYGNGVDISIVSSLYSRGDGSFYEIGWHAVGGDYPIDLAAADLNSDGVPDVVSVNHNWDGGSVLLGSAGPLDLDSPTWFNTGIAAEAVAVGDFTGDGIPDLITAGETVDVLRGNGNGTFAAATHHTANGAAHTGVATADFNGDGHLDAVTADSDTGTVSLMLGNGVGTLQYGGAFDTGASPSGVVAGDFNRDGRPDIAVANAGSNAVSVLLNNGAWPSLPPTVSVRDATVTEGNTGTVNAAFTLTLSKPAVVDVTVHYDTASLTAMGGTDYTATSGTVTIPAGQTSQTFTVAVRGDRLPEPTETFAVNLSSPTNATIGDGQGIGTILDNEPRISINNVSKSEGNGKSTTFTFTVQLSAAYDQAVTVNYATANGTATAGTDYTSKSGTLTFAPGETIKTISVAVKGDKTKEANENFFVDLLGASSNSLIGVARGTGTILDDDSAWRSLMRMLLAR